MGGTGGGTGPHAFLEILEIAETPKTVSGSRSTPPDPGFREIERTETVSVEVEPKPFRSRGRVRGSPAEVTISLQDRGFRGQPKPFWWCLRITRNRFGPGSIGS